ncbi:kinetochore complex Sim4 subunit Fta1-domain-containing protein, partial [Tricharina praecox]|uniref:kinetochore complex Sim4 subunit Fta1-domain-containing protein n=1 Tax=Tricharina praecox TaxID=43433 RepID=UPI00221EC1B7
VHPLYNTTYTLHALTSLYKFPALTAAALKPHSRRLLQRLRGDSLRGVTLPTNTTDPSLSRAGKLLSVTWLPLHPEPPATRGVHIELTYESASYTALLIGSDSGPAEPEGFMRLPLLMSRMPSLLRETLLSYLTTTFDILVLPVALEDELLRRALDMYVDCLEGGGGKSVVMAFAPTEGEGLKRVEITIEAADVGGFWQRRGEGGFLEALGRHCLDAMGLRLEEVALVKVATGGFVLAAEGKGKF